MESRHKIRGTILVDDQFRREIDALIPDHPRVEDFYQGIDWILCHNAEFGRSVSENDLTLRILQQAYPSDPARTLVVYYSFDDEKVYLHSIIESDRSEEN